VTEEVTLGFRTSLGYQYFKLVFCFDAFGAGDNAETAAKADYGAKDCQAILILCDVTNERLIDLDLIEWKTAQIAE
jgi:hypothetical protein